MLVVASNWGLSDGRLVSRPAGGCEWLLTAIHRAVMRSGFRRDGRYRPVDGVDLVLAGDTFDWLVSDAWCGGARPWQAGRGARAVRRAVAIQTLWAARRLMGRLARWVRCGLPVSAADARGRPDWAARQIVPVRLTLLAGDRDFWLTEVVTPTSRHPFSAGLRWSDGMLSVRHGHDLDPACHIEAGSAAGSYGRPPTLAESVAVDLLVPFAVALRSRGTAWHAARPLIRLLAASRPVDIPRRLAAWAAAVVDSGTADVLRSSIEPAWRRAVDAWGEAARRSAPGCAVEFDAVAALVPVLGAALGRPDDAAAAAVEQRLAAADHDPGMDVLGHQPWGCLPQSAGKGCGDVVVAGRGSAAGDHHAAVVVGVDAGGRLHRERLESAAGASAVVTIDRPQARCPVGGRVVDAA
ncbi:MAG: hypothetical protein DWI03_02745 [Planctomycetota bacterium]|nr:MAG: hypothetical protein DWI03_02745 [Planctomycetota bacterium]